MTVRVEVRAALLEWARARSGIDDDVWGKRFPRYDQWVAGERVPTLKQLEEFARKTYTPVGYFFLDDPPVEDLPIPDFRTVGDQPMVGVASVDLLDTLYVCQARQEWYRDSQLLNGEQPLEFVGSATRSTRLSKSRLGCESFSTGRRRPAGDWAQLDPEEFRGSLFQTPTPRSCS